MSNIDLPRNIDLSVAIADKRKYDAVAAGTTHADMVGRWQSQRLVAVDNTTGGLLFDLPFQNAAALVDRMEDLMRFASEPVLSGVDAEPYTGPCPDWCAYPQHDGPGGIEAFYDWHFAGHIDVRSMELSQHPVGVEQEPDALGVEIAQPVLGGDVLARIWPNRNGNPDDAINLTADECDELAELLVEAARQVREFRGHIVDARRVLTGSGRSR